MSKADDHYTRVAEQLIEKLKMGTASWQKPWNAGRYGARPMNPMTGKSIAAEMRSSSWCRTGAIRDG